MTHISDLKTNRDWFDFYTANGIACGSAEDRIMGLINQLISAFYMPTESDACFVVDKARAKKWGVDKEPINWGDLKCSEVEKDEDGWIASVDEASPDDCPNLCEYIERHLLAWGWNITVKTEW